MGSLANLVTGMFVSLFPTGLRVRWARASDANLRTATIVSGLAEAIVCLLINVIRYLNFLDWRVGTIGDAAIKRGAEDALGSIAVQFGSGYAAAVEYVFSPLCLLLTYFTVEGTVRTLAAMVQDEVVGTLPLHLLDLAAERVKLARQERAMGPRVIDRVERCRGISYDLHVASCRPKAGWNEAATIEFEGEYYELYEQKTAGAPRRFVYLLRKISPGKVIRGLHHYQPDEALTEKQKAALAKAQNKSDPVA
jgi:hypothetical protein